MLSGMVSPAERRAGLTGEGPLWRRVEADVRRRLAAGEFSGAFPGELALMEQYAVSRSTVRQALRGLRSSGEVLGQRGRQPRVAAPVEIEQPVGALYSLFATVEGAGIEQRSRVRRLEQIADGVVAERLDLEASTPLIYLERLRLAAGEPLALDRIWLPAGIAAPLLAVDFSHTSVYEELAARCGVRLTDGRERLRAVVPTRAERRLLGVDARTAAFVIERLGLRAGVPLEWRHTLVRGDRFGMSAAFSGRDGYELGITAIA